MQANSLVKEGKFVELIDPGIAYDINEVVIIVLLALKCVRKDPHIRLSMEKVMFTLDYIKDEKTSSYKGKVGDEVNRNVETIEQSRAANNIRSESDLGIFFTDLRFCHFSRPDKEIAILWFPPFLQRLNQKLRFFYIRDLLLNPPASITATTIQDLVEGM
ncbi:hypothetical protein L1987_45412 [Smallanthus sonchifolius]|uniref:Uncharacterized protein n=1 Tax=Smallanthus sonchifolius TaxID=185202 RepID=A0ACB9FXI5_9ASTR|nr:hypothetical protein L1987_45412 [Smallanthus sonchifolius]